MDTKTMEIKIDALKNTIETLILIEFSKSGAKRDDVREVLGTLDNNKFSRINKIIKIK